MIPKSAEAAAPIVRFHASRIETDVDGTFLSNKASTTIGSAAARAETDLHITGCKRSVGVLLTSNPTTVEMQLDPTESRCFVEITESTGATLYMSNRTRVNITASRVAVAIDGTVVNTMSGQASTAVDSLLGVQMQRCSTVVPVVYANWLEISCVIELSNMTFTHPETGRQYDSVVLYDDSKHNATCKRAADALEGLYNQSVQVRKAVVFQPAPPLSKSVMRVPVGIDGSMYDTCSSVVTRPISVERESFESLMASAMRLETNWEEGEFERFKAECKRPGLDASRWSGAVANALSTFVNIVCPYRIDGRVVLTPTGLQMTPAESWKAEASRTAFNTCDDCDGSAAHVTAALTDARKVALDRELSEQLPVTACAANAMSMHFVGVCVLAANAGHANDAGKAGASNIAGHAIAMALPRSMVFDSLITGAMSATQARDRKDSEELVDSLRMRWLNAMFTKQEREALSDEDAKLVNDSESFALLHKNAVVGEMEALAIEGTSPVSPSLLYSRSAQDRISRRRVARGDKQIAELLGPSVARAITQLDVGASNVDTGHVFYNSMVEFILSSHEELFTNAALRSGNYATAQFVLAQPHDTTVAGASPRDVATGNFALLSLWTVGSETGSDLDVALNEVQRNTLPKREGVAQMDEHQSAVYKDNINALRKLNQSRPSNYKASDKTPVSQYIFAMATLTDNRNAVQTFVDKLQALSVGKKVTVSVDIEPMLNVLLDEEGADVGKFVVVNVELV
jgi:hypothetical protein